MELIFFVALIALFGAVSALLPQVGGEGQRDLMQHNVMPPVPLHHA